MCSGMDPNPDYPDLSPLSFIYHDLCSLNEALGSSLLRATTPAPTKHQALRWRAGASDFRKAPIFVLEVLRTPSQTARGPNVPHPPPRYGKGLTRGNSPKGQNSLRQPVPDFQTSQRSLLHLVLREHRSSTMALPSPP